MLEVHANGYCSTFKNEDDAISALWLLSSYHDFEVNEKVVKRSLNKNSCFDIGGLSIIKTN